MQRRMKKKKKISKLTNYMKDQASSAYNIKKWFRQHLELLFWIAAICLLYFLDAGSPGDSVCIFRAVGFNSCPGCGLGHSIHYALHLQLANSIHEHLVGIPAIFIIFSRIYQLTYKTKTNIYEV